MNRFGLDGTGFESHRELLRSRYRFEQDRLLRRDYGGKVNILGKLYQHVRSLQGLELHPDPPHNSRNCGFGPGLFNNPQYVVHVS
jgi:hypothetical protein